MSSTTKNTALAAICEAEAIAATDRVAAALHLLSANVWTVDDDGTVRCWWARSNGEAAPMGGKALSPRLLTLPGGARVSTAQIVWAAWRGERVPEGCQLKHINGNTDDNAPSNLAVVTLAAERQTAPGQLALLDVPAVDVVRPEPRPQCAPVAPVLAPTLGFDGMAEVEPMGIPRGPMVEVMERFDVSVAEVEDVAGESHDIRLALYGLGDFDLRFALLDVAHSRLHLAASALRLDPSRPELWADAERAAQMARSVMEVGCE